MGISELRMVWQIVRIDRSRPPGVSRRNTSAWARSVCARSTARLTSRTVTGVMAPSRSITATGAAATAAGGAAPAASKRRRARKAASGAGFMADSTGPIIARGAWDAASPGVGARRSGAQREDGDQLEQKIGGEEAGDGARPVVGRRHLHDVRAAQVE